jgi:hypothetical protein
MPALQEEVIWVQEATHAMAVHAMVASTQEAAAAWERAAVIVQEAEGRTTLSEREA